MCIPASSVSECWDQSIRTASSPSLSASKFNATRQDRYKPKEPYLRTIRVRASRRELMESGAVPQETLPGTEWAQHQFASFPLAVDAALALPGRAAPTVLYLPRLARNASHCQWQPNTAHLWQPKTAHFWGGRLGRSGHSPGDARRACWAGRRERSDRSPGQHAPRSFGSGGHVATPSRCSSDAVLSQC